MKFSRQQQASRQLSVWVAGAMVALLAAPATALAQYGAPDLSSAAIGEKYHVEFSGSLWNPNVLGTIRSEQFGSEIGSNIDFQNDLGYTRTRFKEMRIVLRPSTKSRFRIQYTPIEYKQETTLKSRLTFNNINFDANIPIESEFAWKVWRIGYEYDFLYKPRGFVGMLVEARYTHFNARLKTATPLISPARDEFSSVKAPLPAIGVVGRAYPLPQLALNFELTGMRLPEVDPDYKAKYFDWDIYGTYNFNNYIGAQMGWRKITTYMEIERDLGDMKFDGLWFGAAVRY